MIFRVHQQPGGNTVQIARQIKAQLAGFRKQLPSGVTIANSYDQSELITASAASVRDAIIIGVIFAVLVLLLFLRNLKITLIAAHVVSPRSRRMMCSTMTIASSMIRPTARGE